MPDLPLFPESASSLSAEVDALYLTWALISVFFATLIALAILFFFVKYRRRDRPVGQPLTLSTLPVEITWSVIPLVITLVMFTWGAKVFFDLSTPPADAVDFYAVGKQWMWKFQHPQGVREINDLHVPVGQAIRVTMTSQDVIHSLYIPAFRVKADVLPGRYTTVWFKPTKAGEYHIFCAEYCGTEHSKMGGTIHVMEQAQYDAWLASGGVGPTLQASGASLFEKLACNTCHRLGDAPMPQGLAPRAPSLEKLYGTRVALSNGREVEADETYLRESILNPRAKVVAGWQPIMPTYQGQVSDEQLNELVAYIKGLAQPPAEAAPTPASLEPSPQPSPEPTTLSSALRGLEPPPGRETAPEPASARASAATISISGEPPGDFTQDTAGKTTAGTAEGRTR